MRTRRFFIAGTDTGVGKTHFTVWLARQLATAGYKVGAYKPVCSGANITDGRESWDDAELLAAAIGGSWTLERIAPQCFRAPFAPPVAAALESREVDEHMLIAGSDWWNDRVDVLLIEGAGGWLSPVSENWTNAELARRLNAPVILVAGNRLGVINQTLLSIAAIKQTCDLIGVVLNEVATGGSDLPPGFDPVQSNREEIERRSGVRLWGVLSHGVCPQLTDAGSLISPRWSEMLSIPPDACPTG
jgi:dethiobiotin synthetase